MSGRASVFPWVALSLVLLAGVVARLIALDRLPGINGDEAWYAVNAGELVAGRPAFLRTPSGNVVNPVHSLPLALLALLAPPSFLMLRVPELCWGLLAVLLAYPLLARPLGRRAAAFTTVLLAVSPTAIVYARFGWDPSGAPLLSLLTIACALRDRPFLAALSGALLVVVHPTNIFLGAIVLAAWWPHAQRRYRASDPEVRRRLVVATGVAMAMAIPLLVIFVAAMARMQRLPSLEMVAARVFSVDAWFDSTLSLVRLVSGTTSVTYVAGPLPPYLARTADALAAALLSISVVAVRWRAEAQQTLPGSRLFIGLAVSAASFHIIAGPVALEPGLERYAMGFVVPLAMLCALGLDALLRAAESPSPLPGVHPRRPSRSTVAAVAAVTLGLTAVAAASVIALGYFQPLIRHGGGAHVTFRTGRVEPKQAAYDFIRTNSANAAVVAIFAEDWWLYWPLRYLAGPERDRFFVDVIGETLPLLPPGVEQRQYPKTPDRAYAVVFADGAAWQRMAKAGLVVFTAFDPLARPIIHVIELQTAAGL